MSLKNLLGVSLDAVAPDKALIGKLFAAADRNLSDYSGDLVPESAAAECLASAAALRVHVQNWLRVNRPELL
jgi:hypothetical protein